VSVSPSHRIRTFNSHDLLPSDLVAQSANSIGIGPFNSHVLLPSDLVVQSANSWPVVGLTLTWSIWVENYYFSTSRDTLGLKSVQL